MATDPLLQPQGEPQATLPKLIKSAWERRPDVQQARLQVINGERQVASAANAAKPEIDLYGSYESRGVVIPGLITIGRRWVDRKCDYRSDSNGGSRSSTLFEAGIQFFLPIQDRVARANLGADKALLRQQVRVTQLESQVAAEVQNAITALHAAESAADAAKDARAAGEATWRLSGEFQRWLRDQPLAHRAANLPGTGANHGGDGQSGVAEGSGPARPSAGGDTGKERHFAQSRSGRKSTGNSIDTSKYRAESRNQVDGHVASYTCIRNSGLSVNLQRNGSGLKSGSNLKILFCVRLAM